MIEFLRHVAEHLVADIILVVLGAVGAYLIALRIRWRLVGAFMRMAQNGVSNVFLTRAEYISRRSRSVNELIESAKRDFTYIGAYFSLATDQSRIDATISALIEKNCRVTIVLLDIEAPAAVVTYLEDHFALARDSLRARAKHAADYFLALRESLAAAKRPLLDIRVHQLPLVTSAFIIDAKENDCTILVDQKWYGVGRDKSLGIEFFNERKSGGLQTTVHNSLNSILVVSRSI